MENELHFLFQGVAAISTREKGSRGQIGNITASIDFPDVPSTCSEKRMVQANVRNTRLAYFSFWGVKERGEYKGRIFSGWHGNSPNSVCVGKHRHASTGEEGRDTLGCAGHLVSWQVNLYLASKWITYTSLII